MNKSEIEAMQKALQEKDAKIAELNKLVDDTIVSHNAIMAQLRSMGLDLQIFSKNYELRRVQEK